MWAVPWAQGQCLDLRLRPQQTVQVKRKKKIFCVTHFFVLYKELGRSTFVGLTLSIQTPFSCMVESDSTLLEPRECLQVFGIPFFLFFVFFPFGSFVD